MPATGQVCVLTGIIRESSHELREQSRHQRRLRRWPAYGQDPRNSLSGLASHSSSARTPLLMARHCPLRSEVAVCFATALCARLCSTARHGKASASRTLGSRSHHAPAQARPPTVSTKGFLSRSTSSLLSPGIAAGQKRLQQLQYLHPSKPPPANWPSQLELGFSEAARRGGQKAMLMEESRL